MLVRRHSHYNDEFRECNTGFRGVVNTQCMSSEEEARVELDETSINPGMNEGSKYRNVMPKSYRILEAQLAGTGPPSVLGQKKAQPQPQAPPPAAAAAQGQ